MGKGSTISHLPLSPHPRASEAIFDHLDADVIDIYHMRASTPSPPSRKFLDTLDTLVSGRVSLPRLLQFLRLDLVKSLSVSERYGWARYVGHQVYYSLIGREYEWELMPLALDQKVGALVWSPLGWGRLTGKIRRGHPLPETSRLHKTADFGPQVDERISL